MTVGAMSACVLDREKMAMLTMQLPQCRSRVEVGQGGSEARTMNEDMDGLILFEIDLER